MQEYNRRLPYAHLCAIFTNVERLNNIPGVHVLMRKTNYSPLKMHVTTITQQWTDRSEFGLPFRMALCSCISQAFCPLLDCEVPYLHDDAHMVQLRRMCDVYGICVYMFPLSQ